MGGKLTGEKNRSVFRKEPTQEADCTKTETATPLAGVDATKLLKNSF